MSRSVAGENRFKLIFFKTLIFGALSFTLAPHLVALELIILFKLPKRRACPSNTDDISQNRFAELQFAQTNHAEHSGGLL